MGGSNFARISSVGIKGAAVRLFGAGGLVVPVGLIRVRGLV